MRHARASVSPEPKQPTSPSIKRNALRQNDNRTELNRIEQKKNRKQFLPFIDVFYGSLSLCPSVCVSLSVCVSDSHHGKQKKSSKSGEKLDAIRTIVQFVSLSKFSPVFDIVQILTFNSIELAMSSAPCIIS